MCMYIYIYVCISQPGFSLRYIVGGTRRSNTQDKWRPGLIPNRRITPKPNPYDEHQSGRRGRRSSVTRNSTRNWRRLEGPCFDSKDGVGVGWFYGLRFRAVWLLIGLAGLAVGNVTGEPNTLPLLEKKQQRERARERERQRDSCSHVGSSHFGSRRERERERVRESDTLKERKSDTLTRAAEWKSHRLAGHVRSTTLLPAGRSAGGLRQVRSPSTTAADPACGGPCPLRPHRDSEPTHCHLLRCLSPQVPDWETEPIAGGDVILSRGRRARKLPGRSDGRQGKPAAESHDRGPTGQPSAEEKGARPGEPRNVHRRDPRGHQG